MNEDRHGVMAQSQVNRLPPDMGQAGVQSKLPMAVLIDAVNSLDVAVNDLATLAEKLVPIPVVPIKDVASERKPVAGLFGEIEDVTRRIVSYRAHIAQITGRIGEKL